METTNGIYNKSLYDAIQPHALLMWQRAQVANFGAAGGADWVDLFARHNSGTYNNQVRAIVNAARVGAGVGVGGHQQCVGANVPDEFQIGFCIAYLFVSAAVD